MTICVVVRGVRGEQISIRLVVDKEIASGMSAVVENTSGWWAVAFGGHLNQETIITAYTACVPLREHNSQGTKINSSKFIDTIPVRTP